MGGGEDGREIMWVEAVSGGEGIQKKKTITDESIPDSSGIDYPVAPGRRRPTD